jgi:LytS/YehU family sensor histidine kinase
MRESLTPLDRCAQLHVALNEAMDCAYFEQEFKDEVNVTCNHLKQTVAQMLEYIPHCDNEVTIGGITEYYLDANDSFKILDEMIIKIEQTLDNSSLEGTGANRLKLAFERAEQSVRRFNAIIEPLFEEDKSYVSFTHSYRT